MRHTIMVTGGAGYIGSHVLVSLLRAGYDAIAVDDLSNGSREAVERAATLAGRPIPLEIADIAEEGAVDALLHKYENAGHPIMGAIHLAGRKAVGESVAHPLRYYDANVCASVCLLRALQQHGVRSLVFSSSATVYGNPAHVPVTESHPSQPLNPYGRTKHMIEQMLVDQANADPDFGVAVLRYFNPIGAHPSGDIGEWPRGTPANVFPYITQVAAGRREYLSIFGSNYDTRDGTGVRDYLHVMDLAEGHVMALEHVLQSPGVLTLNLGTGQGASVLELVHTFERVTGVRIPVKIAERRAGDVDSIWADAGQAARVLGWKAQRSIEQMCEDGWNWQRRHPDGYPQPAGAGLAGDLPIPVFPLLSTMAVTARSVK